MRGGRVSKSLQPIASTNVIVPIPPIQGVTLSKGSCGEEGEQEEEEGWVVVAFHIGGTTFVDGVNCLFWVPSVLFFACFVNILLPLLY